jgi:hypothetical protein
MTNREIENHIERLDNRINVLTHVIKVLSKGHTLPHTLKPLYRTKDGLILGDIFTLDEFEEMVQNGSLIDYDGHGYFCIKNKEMESDIMVTPSTFHFLRPCVSKELTHVIWFNR